MSQLSAEANRVLNHLYSIGYGYRDAVETKVAKELLIYTDGWVIRAGRRSLLRTKRLGAGVTHIWMEAPAE